VNDKKGQGCEEGERTSTKTKKAKLGWGCEEGDWTSTRTKKEKSQVKALRKLHAWPNPLSASAVPISIDDWWLRTRGLAHAITAYCGNCIGTRTKTVLTVFLPDLVLEIRPL
jgi:hypothetical protein